ncbi:MAG TPA: amidohydrolase [Armatimonadota bacterium]|nr:amidohydrolase [Armatimonadota bacterium]
MPARTLALAIGLLVVFGAASTWTVTEPEPAGAVGQTPIDAKLDTYKADVVTDVESMRKFTQQMVDSVFSFGELGFQEFETAKYCADILRKNGFTVEEEVAGIPTQWIASWGSGKPVISLGFDIDGVPQASQKPGVAYFAPLVAGAPGHGEGHSAGASVQITAALAVKRLMERESLPGTIRIWPGIAEEMVATKEYLVKDGRFEDVDAVILAHVGTNLQTSWGSNSGNGLVSVEYMFEGQSAHSAGAPWRGRSALDAVELMNIGVNFRREHLRITQRTHYVIMNGGDQPNVVPPNASVWYYFRETDYPNIRALWDAGNAIADGAALMTNTTVTRRLLGSAWPQHTNRPLAETTYANMQQVGLPEWSEADQRLAKALQSELGQEAVGVPTELSPLGEHVPEEQKRGGGSNDYGHITYNVPAIRLTYPGNIPNLPGHNWANAITMATPIAHKGATAGAKVASMTLVDLIVNPQIIEDGWTYFNDVQMKDVTYEHFITDEDTPAIWANQEIMDRYREEMSKYYYDPEQFDTYLEQLGIEYPTVR